MNTNKPLEEQMNLVTKHELAEYLRMGLSTLDRRVTHENIPHVIINYRGDRLFNIERVMRYLVETYN